MSDFSNNGNLGGFARNQFQLQGEDETTRQQLVAAAQEISRQRASSRGQQPGVQSAIARANAPGAPPALSPELSGMLQGDRNRRSIQSGQGTTSPNRESDNFLEAQRQLVTYQLDNGEEANIRILTPQGEVTPLDDNFSATLAALYGDEPGDIEAFEQGIDDLNAEVKAPGYRELYGRGSPPDTVATSALAGSVSTALDGYYSQAVAGIENEFNARELLLGKFSSEGIATPLQADLGNAIQVNKDYLAARGQDLDLSEIEQITAASNQTAADSEVARRNIAETYANDVAEVLPLIRQQRIERNDAAFEAARAGDPGALKDVGVPQFIIDQLGQEEKDIAEREAALQEQQAFTNQEFRRLRSYAASGSERDAALVANVDEILTGRPTGDTNPAASKEERYRDFVAAQQDAIDNLPDLRTLTGQDKINAIKSKREMEEDIKLVQQILGVDDSGLANDVTFRPELLDEGALDILDVQNQAFGVGNTLARSIGAVAAGAPLTRQGLNPTPKAQEGEG